MQSNKYPILNDLKPMELVALLNEYKDKPKLKEEDADFIREIHEILRKSYTSDFWIDAGE